MKYYCDYCDAFLTHDSPSVRKTHNGGRRHKENVRTYYQKWMEDQAQKLVDATARAFVGSGRTGVIAPPIGMGGVFRPPGMGMMPPPGMAMFRPPGMGMMVPGAIPQPTVPGAIPPPGLVQMPTPSFPRPGM